MKRLIKVSVSDFVTTYPSRHYINRHSNYNIKCTVRNRNLGLLKDSYILELEGDSDNIQMFIDYLRYNKFKIY